MSTRQHEIPPGALKMAWKMVRTVFPRYSVSGSDQDAMLMLAVIIALEDLVGSEILQWRSAPPSQATLHVEKDEIRLIQIEGSRWVIKKNYTSSEVERALDQCESLFDRYDLDETERATLWTALPCLGLHALREYVRWREIPPFAELG